MHACADNKSALRDETATHEYNAACCQPAVIMHVRMIILAVCIERRPLPVKQSV